MYDVSVQLYQQLYRLLSAEIGERGYYSGVLEFSFGEVDCSLHLSAVIYRKRDNFCEGGQSYISDIIPVWWEFHTNTSEGEVLNNFSFNELRELIKE